MTRQDSLTHRVRELLRHHPVRVLTEREASDQLRPYGQGVIGVPALAPLNHARPSAGHRLGARVERELEDAESTA